MAGSISNEELNRTYVLGAIQMYLTGGETSEEMIKKFKGDINKTLHFLQERKWSEDKSAHPQKTRVKSEDEDNILHEKYNPSYTDAPDKKLSKAKRSNAGKKPTQSKSPQRDLF